MGAWNYGLFDNDDALDFWPVLRDSKTPMKEIEKALNERENWAQNKRRAAAAMVKWLLQFDGRTIKKLKNESVKALKEMRSNRYFTDDWKQPATIKRRLDKEIKELE